MTENLPLVIQDGPGQNELDVEEVYRRVQKVQAVKTRLMKENIHYGKIPGTDRDTLFKAGAETLMMAFRLSPKYTHTETWSDEHLTILSRCDLYHIGSGNFVGSGEGMCSTMESKYRYRLGTPEPTDRPVPKAYWDAKKAGKMDDALKMLGGKGFTTVKTEAGAWMIAKKSTAKVDNPDIADVYNTVLKMANKRAKVDAAITALAISDMFTQDMEEGYAVEETVPPVHHDPPPEQRPAPASTQGASNSATEGAPAAGSGTGSLPPQTVLTALYNGMKAAAGKDGLAGLVKWWREHQKEIKALPEPGANQIAAWKEEFKSVLEIGGGE